MIYDFLRGPRRPLRLKRAFRAQDGHALLNILRSMKTCDPAVGSGAFPVGLLHELVNLRRIAETIANGFVDPARREGSNWIHETKADIVENCLYGVDIQQQAIEICRLRLWLSLVVDYDLGLDPFKADAAQFDDAIRQISQLPNLEMNFRRGDSLLDMIGGVNVRIEYSTRYRKEYEYIRKLSRDLHKARKGERKRKLRVDILRRRLELTDRVLGDETKQLQTQDSNLAGTWFDQTESESQRRDQLAREIQRLQNAMKKVGDDRKMLERIAAQPYGSLFYPKLRKLEGAEFDAPFNFAWRLDFADIFRRSADQDEGVQKVVFTSFWVIHRLSPRAIPKSAIFIASVGYASAMARFIFSAPSLNSVLACFAREDRSGSLSQMRLPNVSLANHWLRASSQR